MPTTRRTLSAVLLLLSLTASPALSAQDRAAAGADPAAIPPALDPQFRHRKRHQLELTAFGGTYLGPSIKKSWITGARAYFHLNNMFALGASYGYQWTAVDSLHISAPPLTDRHTHFLDAEVAISNDVAMRVGQTVIELDLYMTLGLGTMRLDGNWEYLAVVGGGLKAYTGIPWLAVRIDVNNFLHRVRKPMGDTVDMDVSFALGVSFLLPPDPSPPER